MHSYSHYRGPRRRREKEAEKIFEDIIAENIPNLGKETDIKSRKHRVSQRGQSQRTTPRHTVIKMTKIKDK